ncbi:threonine--tRNA ligase [Patescibacteria group bacterium]|nr:threonine--tRNA ligase [Patescibacteria group bacterium]
MTKEEILSTKRHSLAHLLAAAVLEIWPQTKRTIGPAIENGFYYDFEFPEPISQDDLPKIENKMKEILLSWSNFEKKDISYKEAKEFFADNPYKLELIEEFNNQAQQLTLYTSGKFTDLCRGGHADNLKEIDPQSFKLDRLAGAYWRGDEANIMLTRIYGLAFNDQQELNDYLELRIEAQKRDHRKLGKELDLFVFAEEVGPGLPLWTDKGATIRREIERFITDEEIKRDYKHVITPDIARVKLYEISGHYPYYKDTMYPVMNIDEDKLVLRPMTCPHHFMLYKDKLRSYRELPLRLAELAQLYRYEKSGELTGLMRVRTFCLADSHIFCRPDQALTELKEVIDLIEFSVGQLGFEKGVDYSYRLSLGDINNTKKYYDAPDKWQEAEKSLKQVLTDLKAPFVEAPDEAAFYGPKIDIQMKNVLGKEDTAFTIQYDFCLPARFNLEYINEQGIKEQPVVIHRSSVGALERTIAFMIEKTAGNFPLWLSPIQVKILPVGQNHHDFCQQLAAELKTHQLRVEVDFNNETVGNKIRQASQEKIPYSLVIGDKEIASGKLAARVRGQKELLNINKEDFINKLLEEIKTRS